MLGIRRKYCYPEVQHLMLLGKNWKQQSLQITIKMLNFFDYFHGAYLVMAFTFHFVLFCLN